MEWYDPLIWAMQRPQQALFQGAQAGGNAMAVGATQLANKGMPRWAGLPISALLSTIPAAKAAAGAFMNPQEKDVRGSYLTQDAFDSPTMNTIAGAALDITADPLALAGGIGTRAPQMARTARNLASAAGTPYAGTAGKVMGNNPLKWLTRDVPLPVQEGVPWLIKEEGGHIGRDLASAVMRKGSYESPIAASYPSYAANRASFPGVIGSSTKDLPVNLAHEGWHLQWPGVPWEEAKGIFQNLETKQPGWYKSMVNRYGSNVNNPTDRADEALAILTEMKQFSKNPTIRAAQEASWNHPAEWLKQAPGAGWTAPVFGGSYLSKDPWSMIPGAAEGPYGGDFNLPQDWFNVFRD